MSGRMSVRQQLIRKSCMALLQVGCLASQRADFYDFFHSSVTNFAYFYTFSRAYLFKTKSVDDAHSGCLAGTHAGHMNFRFRQVSVIFTHVEATLVGAVFRRFVV